MPVNPTKLEGEKSAEAIIQSDDSNNLTKIRLLAASSHSNNSAIS